MDIKKIMPTAEIEFTLDRLDDKGAAVAVKLTVNYVSIDELADFIEPGKKPRLSKVVREILIDAVVGWDLTEEGKPIPCDDANKRRILPVLFGTRTKGESLNPFDLVLGRRLLEFAGDDGNFLKN